jgi:hypothetical protein
MDDKITVRFGPEKTTPELDDLDPEDVNIRQAAYDLLMSPYTSMQPWAITRVCMYFKHPLTPRGERCPCGKIKQKKDA